MKTYMLHRMRTSKVNHFHKKKTVTITVQTGTIHCKVSLMLILYSIFT